MTSTPPSLSSPELGMELEGRMPVEGSWAGNVVGLAHMRSEIAMMRVPNAPGRLELATYHTPKAVGRSRC